MQTLGGTNYCYFGVHSCTSVCNYVQRYAMYNMLILWGSGGGGGGGFEIPRPPAYMGLMCTFIITSVQYYRLNNH